MMTPEMAAATLACLTPERVREMSALMEEAWKQAYAEGAGDPQLTALAFMEQARASPRISSLLIYLAAATALVVLHDEGAGAKH